VSSPDARVALAAFPLGLALAVYPLLGAGTAVPPIAILGGLALLLYLTAVEGVWPGALGGAVGLLAVEYLASEYLRGAQLSLGAPAYGACLFLWAELGWLAVDGGGAGSWPSRWVAIGGLALVAAALGWGLLVVAALPVPGGLGVTVLGVAAALAAAGGLAWLARSADR
jgi:hypothetical protein